MYGIEVITLVELNIPMTKIIFTKEISSYLYFLNIVREGRREKKS